MEALTAESLLARWFWPHYPPDVRAAPFLHRDVDANPGANPALTRHLGDAAERFVANAPALLDEAVTLDDAGVEVLARALTRARRDAWMASGDPADPSNVFFNAVVHGAMFLGEVIAREHGGRWELRRPLWESVVHRRRGGAVSPFHWLLKSLADDAVDERPLAVRWRLHVLQDDLDPTTLPRLTEATSLPTLKSPSYDTLVKLLHQHLEALRDLGEGFPSPREFTERAYPRLSFTILHGGRVVVAHGQTRAADGTNTVELHWLTARGHDHTDVLPMDPDVPYFARALGEDAMEVTLAWRGGPHTHRLTLRGHG